MPFSTFLLYLNFGSAIFDFLGRFFSFKPYTKLMVYSSQVTHAIMDIFIIYFYFKDSTLYHEGVAYLMFPFTAFCLFRTAFSIGHYMIQSSIKA
jgi:hypothetical protein